MPPVPFEIRIARDADLPFILDSWGLVQSHLYPNRHALDFRSKFAGRARSLIERSVSLVAHLEGDPDTILGYLVYGSFRGSLVAHFAYVKVDARRQGLLRALLAFANPESLPVVFTHAAKSERVMDALWRRAIFDPSVMELL